MRGVKILPEILSEPHLKKDLVYDITVSLNVIASQLIMFTGSYVSMKLPMSTKPKEQRIHV